MSTLQARKEANASGQFYSVKVSFHKIFPDEALSAKVQQAVDLVTPIVTEGSLLANLHVLRCAEMGGDMPKIDQTFFNQCYAAVTHSTGHRAQQFRSEDHPALSESYTVYRESLPDDHAKPERPTYIKDVSTS